MLEKDLSIHPRQSGKTASLKLKAIELYSQFNKVYFITHNGNTLRELKMYFNSLNIDIECNTIDTFNYRYCKEITEIPPEYRLVYTGGIHIILDEYMLMNQNKFRELINNLTQSKDKFCVYGKSTTY